MIVEKDITTSINNYKCIYLATKKLVEHFHLPLLRDMGAPEPIAICLKKLENNINNQECVIGIIPKITKKILKKCIISPSK